MATIPRNHTKRIAALKATLITCRIYTKDNDYSGQPVDPIHAWDALAGYRFARLTGNGNGKYTVSVTSNRWYELTP